MNPKKQLVFWLPVVILSMATIVVSLGLIISRAFSHKDDPHVSFSEWVPVQERKAQRSDFRFAVACMVSPEETWVTYKELVEYISEHLGNDASMVLKPTYGEVRALLEQNAVHSAFVCTGTYMACVAAGSVELLAVPEFKEDMRYRCLFVARAGSGIDDVQGFRDKSFAFTDPESNTGCIVPKWAMMKIYGFDPETYFSRTLFTKSHDRSIRAVARGVVDGAGVDSLIYYSMVRADPDLRKKLKVIWQSEAFGAPPIVVPVGLPEEMREKLRAVLFSMPEDSKGREILDGLDIERFRAPDENEYHSAYEIWKVVRQEKEAGRS
ncbi:MAG: substrate-binding domain-containing protein [Planctomycetota bacterium]|jgi:phosphonate transport system substrate-binding protein